MISKPGSILTSQLPSPPLINQLAFDCIDHEIMISHLQHMFGVTNLALRWFVSYFAAGRCLYAEAASCLSWPHTTTVSRRDQPSDLCASIYTWPLCHVWLAHLACGITNMLMTPKCALRLRRLISRRISIRLKNALPLYISGYSTIVCSWIQANLRWFSSQLVEDVSKSTTYHCFRSPTPPFNHHPRSKLGITLDWLLTFDQHVANVCKACYFHIRSLRHVRQSLPDDVARMLPAA